MPSFPFFRQFDAMDCGPACLRMIAAYYGKSFSIQTLRERSYITREGVSMLGVSDAAESIGIRTKGVRISYDQLSREVPLPCIVHWKQKHFIVVYRIKKEKILVADPALGKISLTRKEFLDGWISSSDQGTDQGLCLLLEPTPDFYNQEDEKIEKGNFRFLFSYLKPQKKFVIQLILGLLFGSLLQLIFPFLTQQVVDFGINNQDVGFIYLILIAQLVLFISRMSVDFIRGWILLHLGTRVNISLISDFLIKMMRLPIAFFDSKLIGDLLQRIGDHRRIELFLTSSTLNILFSFLNLVIFGIVLAIYSLKIFWIYLIGSALYTFWVYLFMKRRRELDFRKFKQLSDNQSNLIQLITGMQEIKLNNIEKQKRWEWETIQTKLFRVNVRSLTLNQYQQAGATFINETKNIVITIMAATAVITGDMTLGMMLAVQYILGQLNSPLDQMIGFFHKTQDARISLERLAEIHQMEDEEISEEEKISTLPDKKDISLTNLSFQYEGPHSPFVLKDINLNIPEEKQTAIVGVSGSGKTTLIKLILGFYQPVNGEVKIGDIQLKNYSSKFWRETCGVVMQDGFIFSDSITRNIVMGDEYVDKDKLRLAVQTANIREMIESLPMGYNTRIGSNGHGLSEGQKQRILIARAVYKDPEYLFFDEATNALDANNEMVIMNNLKEIFAGKTVIVVAHRLSTVKNAHQIVVLDKGQIVEKGTHEELTKKQGHYFNLVRNQLELGN
ncbi:MAG: peptidase domain-containing ABC transporter [Bacteroidales bacterium]|nr:MAG: peptidase domain-containing ABC transporter [Bacteroidales bacterium]